MDQDKAQQASDIIAKKSAVSDVLGRIQNAQQASSTFVFMRMANVNSSGLQIDLDSLLMTVEESTAVLQALIDICNARDAALDAQLAAL